MSWGPEPDRWTAYRRRERIRLWIAGACWAAFAGVVGAVFVFLMGGG